MKDNTKTGSVVRKTLSSIFFHKAEKNPLRYMICKKAFGRPLPRQTKIQHEVTRQEATEPPFQNEYWDNKQEGIYVDIISGDPLFSSKNKFDSQTGWPSFTKPINQKNVVEAKSPSGQAEVKSKKSGSHLGHVFSDAPPPTGLRYCINSAALRFIPKKSLKSEDYSKYI